MASAGKIAVTVEIDELVERLADVLADVSELSDLVPDWSSLEAEKIEHRIHKNLDGLLKAKT